MKILITLLVTILVTLLVVGFLYRFLRWKGFDVPEKLLTWKMLVIQSRNLGFAYLFSILPNVVIETYLTSGEVSVILRISTFIVTYLTVGTLGVMITWFEWYGKRWKMNSYLLIYLTKTIPSLLFWIPIFTVKTGVIWYLEEITSKQYCSLMIWYLISVSLFAVIPTLIADKIGEVFDKKKK